MVLVAQGAKRFHFPDAVVTYDTLNFLLVTVPVPANCEALVGTEGPFLGLSVRIDLQVVADMLMRVPPQPRNAQACSLTISAPAMDVEVASVGVRLLQAMRDPVEAAVLGPLLVRELHYRALVGPAGGMLRASLNGSRSRSSVHRVLEKMHTAHAAPFQVKQLAREAGMSVSAFHERFRAVTGHSPLHYFKLLRLHRARSLMIQSDLSAACACEQVGYISQSQFSREFKSLFGRTPLQEVKRMRAHLGLA